MKKRFGKTKFDGDRRAGFRTSDGASSMLPTRKGVIAMEDRSASGIGHVASLVAAAAFSFFAAFLVAGLFGADTKMASFAVCLVAAPFFVAMLAALHRCAAPKAQTWSLLGLAFALIYAVFILLTYYTQLAVLRINNLGLSPEVLKAFEFTPGSVLFAVDMLGYAFMTLSTLVIIPVFGTSRLEKGLKALLLIHGLMFIPTIIFPLMRMAPPAAGAVDFGSIALLGWCAVFVPLASVMAVWFRRFGRQ